MSTPPTNEAMEFDCPLCGGAFEASPEILGQQVECPHCGQVVELPAAQEIAEEIVAEPEPSPTLDQPEPELLPLAPPTPSVAPAPDSQPTPEPAPKPVRPLTRVERAAARKRFNLILAAVGGVILLLAFMVLAGRS